MYFTWSMPKNPLLKDRLGEKNLMFVNHPRHENLCIAYKHLYLNKIHPIYVPQGFCMSGACPGFLKGGGSNISWFPKKRSSDFKRGVQWSEGGGSSTFVSLGRQILHI